MELQVKRNRTRFKLKMNSKLPRVSVDKSNRYFFAQLVDVHSAGKVLAALHEKAFVKTAKLEKDKPVARAEKMGEAFGKLVKEAGFTAVAFDRSGYVYHGKVKAFADGLRKAGLTL
ncbi:MAG: 50S ribosomal protein L18 [Candidatus Dojkabacteria bacterium]|nr:MAG: 50S ribosomal protein L18 [Candidatus Dojkabacteria bacterium]